MRLHAVAVLALVVATAACSGDGPAGPDDSGKVVIAGPSTLAVVVGDTAFLTATPGVPGSVVTWTSSKPPVATASGGAVAALRDGTASIIASVGGAADTVSVTVTPRPNGYGYEEVDYFTEIALGFEYGGASRVVRRWNRPIRYRVLGEPADADRATLAGVVAEINALTSLVDMVEVDSLPLVEIHFAPVSQFPGILPSYVPGNIGYFAVWFDGTHHFTRAVVLIANDRDRAVRDHLIREEVTQILGLGRDSDRYPASIFYQQWSLVTQYTAMDRALIEMLYRPEVLPGMDEGRVAPVLRRLTRGVVAVAPSPTAAVHVDGAGVEIGQAAGGTAGWPPVVRARIGS